MTEIEQEKKRLVAEGKLKLIVSRSHTGKISHKPLMPINSKKWSLKPEDYALLRFGFFWEMSKKEMIKCLIKKKKCGIRF